MAKLSLSEVSRQFNVDRSTIYRAVKNGRLSRSADGQFDITEIIRCFGDPKPKSKKIDTQKFETDDATKKLILNLENEVRKYQEREERLMQQIDRMQTLIELKSVAPATAELQPDATACDTTTQQHATIPQNNEKKEEIQKKTSKNIEQEQPDTIACDTTTQQHATLQSVATPQSKKRGLFGRLARAVFSGN